MRLGGFAVGLVLLGVLGGFAGFPGFWLSVWGWYNISFLGFGFGFCFVLGYLCVFGFIAGVRGRWSLWFWVGFGGGLRVLCGFGGLLV